MIGSKIKGKKKTGKGQANKQDLVRLKEEGVRKPRLPSRIPSQCENPSKTLGCCLFLQTDPETAWCPSRLIVVEDEALVKTNNTSPVLIRYVMTECSEVWNQYHSGLEATEFIAKAIPQLPISQLPAIGSTFLNWNGVIYVKLKETRPGWGLFRQLRDFVSRLYKKEVVAQKLEWKSTWKAFKCRLEEVEKRMEKLEELMEEHRKAFEYRLEELEKRMEERRKQLEERGKQWEELKKRVEEHDKQLEELKKGF